MTNIEQEFFKTFGIGAPVVKCVMWDNGMFAHYDDWEYVQRTFKELKLNISVEELNKRIKECKEKDPENIKHNGYCFSNGCFVEAFYQYPKLTDRVLLELICILNKFNIMDFYCKSTNIEQLKITILSYCIFTVEHNYNAEQFKTQVQSLFREEGE